MIVIVNGYIGINPTHFSKDNAKLQIKGVYFVMQKLKMINIYLKNARWLIDMRLSNPLTWIYMAFLYTFSDWKDYINLDITKKTLTYHDAPNSTDVNYHEFSGTIILNNIDELNKFMASKELVENPNIKHRVQKEPIMKVYD